MARIVIHHSLWRHPAPDALTDEEQIFRHACELLYRFDLSVVAHDAPPGSRRTDSVLSLNLAAHTLTYVLFRWAGHEFMKDPGPTGYVPPAEAVATMLRCHRDLERTHVGAFARRPAMVPYVAAELARLKALLDGIAQELRS